MSCRGDACVAPTLTSATDARNLDRNLQLNRPVTGMRIFLVALAVVSVVGVAACSPHYVLSRPLELANLVAPAPSLTKNVLLVSIDGLRPDAIAKFSAPTLQRLIREGRYSLSARTIMPSTTLPSHTSMLSGERPEVHGVSWNNV